MEKKITIQSNVLSSQELFSLLQKESLAGVELQLEENKTVDRSIFVDPIVISAMVAGGVTIISKLIDALIEIYKIKQEKKNDQHKEASLKIEFRNSLPIEINLKQIPEDNQKRKELLLELPELQNEEIQSIVLNEK